MRHRKEGRTFGREKAPREAMMRSLAESLILHGSITTTTAKAKELRRFVEPLVTKAKSTRGSEVSKRRTLTSELYTDKAVVKLMKDIAPQYVGRSGGYTRITKIGNRFNDAADMSVIEFVS